MTPPKLSPVRDPATADSGRVKIGAGFGRLPPGNTGKIKGTS